MDGMFPLLLSVFIILINSIIYISNTMKLAIAATLAASAAAFAPTQQVS